jgi:hypothetical protein
MFASVDAAPEDVARGLPGDDLIPRPDVVMDRAFDLPAPSEEVWPWFVQLGKKRAGWYLPRNVERFSPLHAEPCATSNLPCRCCASGR